MGVDNLVVLACVLRATTKKVVNFWGKKSAPSPPKKNPGYAYASMSASCSIAILKHPVLVNGSKAVLLRPPKSRLGATHSDDQPTLWHGSPKSFFLSSQLII